MNLPDLTQYDAVEIHPVSKQTAPDGVEMFDQCDPHDADLHCWSVYLHCRTGGLDCIADCASEPDAQLVALALEHLINATNALEPVNENF